MAVDDSYTKLLLHMDGADNGTTFTDESGKTVTVGGNVCTKTGIKKFGTASAYFDGANEKLDFPNSADWYFDTGDFTIDYWVYPTSLSDYRYHVTKRFNDTNRWLICHDGSGRLYFQLTVGGSDKGFYQTASSTLVLNQWQHIAVVRNGTGTDCIKIYVDGVDKTPTSATKLGANAIPDFAAALCLGHFGDGGYAFQGYMDEVRISKGVARWTAAFTPPTEAYEPAEPPSSEGILFATII